jgi:hypothetical protein
VLKEIDVLEASRRLATIASDCSFETEDSMSSSASSSCLSEF